MNELLREFLTEAHENLDVVDVELVRFEREPNNADLLGRIFRLVHTIKGTCGFLGLPRLEALTHAAETLMRKFRDGTTVTPEAVSLILSVIDRIKEILGELDRSENEPSGDDDDLIRELERTTLGETVVTQSDGHTVGKLVYQVLERRCGRAKCRSTNSNGRSERRSWSIRQFLTIKSGAPMSSAATTSAAKDPPGRKPCACRSTLLNR